MNITGFQTVIVPVRDLEAAKTLYGSLYGTPYADTPYYVGYKVAGQDLGLDPNGHAKGMTGPIAYCDVEDIAAAVKVLAAAGAEIVDEPKDVGGGKLIALVRDTDGNPLGLAQNPSA